ncbi:MAG: hypothetical protein KY467_02440 [Gemmatimonadetes bacterium]|nr:hypothetical protein [Gemmatimonadota bacterium]
MNNPTDEAWTEADDIIEEVREIRRKISARFDDDPVKLGEFLMESQKRHGDRLVYPGTRSTGTSTGRDAVRRPTS